MSIGKVICLGANNPETIRFFNAMAGRFELEGFIDNDPDKWGTEYFGYTVFGGRDKVPELAGQGFLFCNMITRDCVTRHASTRELTDRGARLCNLVHPSVDLEMVIMGSGNFVQEGAVLQAQCKLGDNVAINMGSLVGHESSIGDSAFVAPGATICGIVEVGMGVLVGAGATILPRLKIGAWATIGAGAVVTTDVEECSVVAGNPARVIRRLDPDTMPTRGVRSNDG